MPVTRRELLALFASAALVPWQQLESEPEDNRLIEYWLLTLDDALNYPLVGIEALQAASELKLAIEAEGVPEKWSDGYRVLCGTQFRLEAEVAIAGGERRGMFCS